VSHVYDVVDASTSEVLHTFGDPKEAGQRAARYTARKVRVVKRAADTPEEETRYYVEAYRCDGRCCRHGPGDFGHETVTEHGPDMVPADGVEWRRREALRCCGEIPWLTEHWWRTSPEWLSHYPRVSQAEPAKLVFTPSEEWGMADRQLRMSPGRYLRRYFGSVLDAEQVQYFALLYANANAPVTMQIAMTSDDIEEVYVGGPNSCMAGPASGFNSPVHPVRMYGAGDLGVAYLGTTVKATARAVVWPEKRVYGRVYGDEARLEHALREAGYRPAGEGSAPSFEGARLVRYEPDTGGYVAPYIDGPPAHAIDDGQYLILQQYGDLYLRETGGLIGGGQWCDHCQDYRDSDSFYTVGHETWCESCFEDDAMYCEHCGENYATSDTQYSETDQQSYCDDCYRELFRECDDCGEEVAVEDVQEGPDGEDYCDACHAARFAECFTCGEVGEREDMTEGDDGEWRCSDCHETYVTQLELELNGEEVSEDAA
jgi:hypothetical protein